MKAWWQGTKGAVLGQGTVEKGQRFDIEGNSLFYPTEFRKGSSSGGIFLVPARVANEFIADSGFEVARAAPGRAIFSLSCVHYTDTDCGAYDEIAMAFFVNPKGKCLGFPYFQVWRDLAAGQLPTYTWKLPVSSTLARDAGRFMWGFPKTVEEIDFEDSGGHASFTLRMSGQEVLKYSVASIGTSSPAPVSSPVYSNFAGRPHVSFLTQRYEDSSFKFRGGELTLGNHPVADALRALKLGKTPLLSSWMGKLHFDMSAPTPLVPSEEDLHKSHGIRGGR